MNDPAPASTEVARGAVSGDELNFGSRLSAAEYDRRITGLRRELPPRPTKAQKESARERELNLKIDHRLGINFPQDRRAALWETQCEAERKKLRLAFKYLLRRLLGRGTQPGHLADEFARVLTKRELSAFLDGEQG